jgi:hypothetical protein
MTVKERIYREYDVEREMFENVFFGRVHKFSEELEVEFDEGFVLGNVYEMSKVTNEAPKGMKWVDVGMLWG